MAGTSPERASAGKIDIRMRRRLPRVAITCAFFEPEHNYIEVTLARAFSSRADVVVISSEARLSAAQGSPVASRRGQDLAGVEIRRLSTLGHWRGRVWARGVHRALAEVQPDLIVQLSPSQIFSLPATRYGRRSQTPLVVISGEHRAQSPQAGPAKWIAAGYNSWFRAPLQRYSASAATLVIGATPETAELLSEVTGRRDVMMRRLPFDEVGFEFNSSLRSAARQALSDGLITLFAGKFVERKDLIGLVEWWRSAFTGPQDRLLLIGAGNNAYSESVRSHVAVTDDSRVIVRPFAPAHELSALMNAADLGVFPNATIAIQQAMGTGMAVLVPDLENLRYLSDHPYREAVTRYSVHLSAGSARHAAAELTRQRGAILSQERRAARAAFVQQFSAGAYVAELLERTELADGGRRSATGTTE